MSSEVGYQCSVSGLAWATGDQELQNAFSQFGQIIDFKTINNPQTGRFGFVTFKDEKAVRDAIDVMNGKELGGRTITVRRMGVGGGGGGGGGGGYRGGGGGYRRYGAGSYNGYGAHNANPGY